jgi:hypothetical protein
MIVVATNIRRSGRRATDTEAEPPNYPKPFVQEPRGMISLKIVSC